MSNATYVQWYNENEGRAYPLSDLATQLDNNGRQFPTDIIADLSIVIPSTYSDVRISSVRITSQLISVGISSSTTGLLVGTYARSSSVYKAQPLTAVVSNVSGWITFGNHIPAAVEDYRFSTVDQSRIATKAVRVVDPPQVTGLIRLGNVETQLATGIVRIEGGSGISIEKDPLSATNIIVRLKPEFRSKLAGPCSKVASASSCGTPVIRRINGIEADENGVFTLRFE